MAVSWAKPEGCWITLQKLIGMDEDPVVSILGQEMRKVIRFVVWGLMGSRSGQRVYFYFYL